MCGVEKAPVTAFGHFANNEHFTQPCHVCVGMGRKPCKDCAGAGNVSHFRTLLRQLKSSVGSPKFFFLAPVRKCAGCAMDLVFAMEMIDAITAMAEGGKSEYYPLHFKDF